MTVEKRQRMERRIARSFLTAAIAAGFLINIDNGGDEMELPEPTGSIKTAMETMFATDEERVYLFKPGNTKHFGWAFFVYGNDGYDVIADHTVSDHMTAIMMEPSKLSDRLADTIS